MKRRIRTLAVLLAMLVGSTSHAQIPQGLNLHDNGIVFSGTGRGSLPDLNLFRDSINNAIGMACIHQPSIAALQKLGFPDLANRLELLSRSNDILINKGRCSLNFTVLVGARREELKSTVTKASEKLAPRVARLAQRLREGVPERPDMVFHLLWSRVMDDSWDKAWKATFTLQGPADAVWVIYPGQRYDVGTNFSSVPGSRSYALTWSPVLRPQLQDLS